MSEPTTSPAGAPAAAAPFELSGPGRRWRLALTALLVVLLGWGTVWGFDRDFPFGPMRQYATATSPNGTVWVTHVYGTFSNGSDRLLGQSDVGMRLAEFDGQYDRIKRHPSLLIPLASFYLKRFPGEPTLVRLRVQRDGKVLHGNKIVKRKHNVVAAVWAHAEGTYWATNIYGRFADGKLRKLNAHDLGIRMPVFNQQLDVVRDRPALLRSVGVGYRRLAKKGTRALRGVVVRRDGVVLHNRKVVSRKVQPVAEEAL
ncbi:MAG: hypothetical protein JWM05_298 [Acidimicrobiales bacterium]|nr:hypothetical protein [Acidimicrobiales bacterium]